MDLNTMQNTVSPKVIFSDNVKQLDFNTVKGMGERMITLGLKKSAEKIIMQKKSMAIDTLADSKAAAQATNISIDPSTAIEINADIAYSIGTAAAGQQLLVKINTDNILKLTAITSFSAATTFQTFVFTLNAQNEINQIVQSIDYFGSFDVVSFLPKGGYYYVLIYITAGGGDMQFQLAKSDTCSAAEPNDTPSTLTAKVNGFKLTDMFDNINDLDAVHLSVTKPNDAATTPETMSMSFIFNDSNINGNVNLYIYNVQQGTWGIAATLPVPFINVKWAPPEFGDYYVYVQPTSADLLNKGYVFSGGQLSADVAQVNRFDLTEMFDSINDIDTVHLNITKPNDTATVPETVYMSFIFKDINAKGNIILRIFNVTQGTWSLNKVTLNVPFITQKWKPETFGEYCVFVQPTSTDLLNKEYTFSAGQLSAIIVPFSINVGSVTSYRDYGKYGGEFWVNGGSCVILGWARGVKDGSDGYACPDTPLEIEITGKDAGDVTRAYAVTDKNGNFQMTVSLPYSYGKDGAFSGYKYIHSFDIQPVKFYGINGKDIYSNMDVILNVVD
ncbi:MAG: hypothetical protein H6Q70_4276 [Firmicutes bacterium]|nr:hypothetical protein [Bacillota bacterium]